ncbi:pilus assembly protein PilM [Acetivibrio mesophilus]|uniref:Pilus assembly protein PilM n=1 Tax=Acetivibrio mesophilus TaxID=2487273 RepID=A0A4Q0I8W2_9FIRM|nr:pilus assembly protein PilM [Acetivibrio mesophilus]ODM27482.1 pilus assembly protein PilM [Clostridium sp. Bc-iso-3]RXE59442.1 pilus assembly protein PilM [Acetivibrio mesophilus]HHV30230.1 pilus assembly protein PilM [Clostridium sp.]
MVTIPFIKTNLLSIDIGFRNIKIVEVELSRNNEIFIKNFGIASTPKGSIKNGAIKDVKSVTNEIKKVMENINVKAKSAKIVMSGTNIISRVFVIEKIPGEDMNHLVRTTISQSMPIDLDAHQIDYKVLQEFREDGIDKIKVFVTAVLKSIIQSYIDILIELGLKPVSVDIPANSAAKFFNREIMVSEDETWFKKKRYSKLSQNTFAVVDFGSETTIVNILKDKVLEFNKVILRGSSNLDEAIAASTGKNIEEAERLKKIQGFDLPDINVGDEQEKIHSSIKSVIDEIVRQMFQCFEFYEKRCYGEKVGKIYIIGGGALLKGLREYLEEVFQVPIYPVGLLSIEGIQINKGLDGERLNYLINSVGITL